MLNIEVCVHCGKSPLGHLGEELACVQVVDTPIVHGDVKETRYAVNMGLNLLGRDVIVLDLETLHSADDCRHCGMPFEGCQANGHSFEKIGWDDKASLGLSIGCYFSYLDGIVHWFDPPSLADHMAWMVKAKPLIVSFNGLQFDVPLMLSVIAQQAQEFQIAGWWAFGIKHYDILAQIWRQDPKRKFERGLNSLDAIAQANGLGAKTGHGAQAPRDWQAGKYADVMNYCQWDVMLTKKLFELILSQGFLLRGDGRPVYLPKPEGL